MKVERITIRIDDELKKELDVYAKRYEMNTSEFINTAIKEKIETDKLTDSQQNFLKLFDIAFKQSYEPFFKQMMVVINRCEFNTRWSIKQQDIFMGNLKVPQEKDEVAVSVIDHPITEIAHEKILKDIRKMSARKNQVEDE